MLDLRTVEPAGTTSWPPPSSGARRRRAMTLVVGTAGHIDHGKTTLLRALTGIDADRLPEERRRGMTIDVGYAHLDLDDGTAIDFVDVPGTTSWSATCSSARARSTPRCWSWPPTMARARRRSNTWRCSTRSGSRRGLAVVTKIDAVDPERVAAVVARPWPPSSRRPPLPAPRSWPRPGSPGRVSTRSVPRSSTCARRTGPSPGPPTLAIDRVFSVKGRGAVVTGTLRGGPWRRATCSARARRPGRAGPRGPGPRGGRRRGRRRWAHRAQPRGDRGRRAAPRHGADGRCAGRANGPGARHVRWAGRGTGRARGSTRGRPPWMRQSVAPGATRWTSRTGRRRGPSALPTPVALAPGDRFVLRRGPAMAPVGGVVLDVAPPRGISRRRQTAARVATLRTGVPERDRSARTPRRRVRGRADRPRPGCSRPCRGQRRRRGQGRASLGPFAPPWPTPCAAP